MADAVRLIRHNTTQSCSVACSYSSNAKYIYGVNCHCTTVYVWIFARFIFCGFEIFAHLNSRLLATVVLKYTQVKYSWIYGVNPYAIIVYGSWRKCKTCWIQFSAAYLVILAFGSLWWSCHIGPFHRPHGRRSTLLSCSHARSALHFLGAAYIVFILHSLASCYGNRCIYR